jgi:hypothetical protein
MSTITSSNLGITFVESHPATAVDWHGEGLSLKNPARLTESVADHPWTVADTACRPNLVANFQWNASNLAGAKIFEAELPWGLLTSTAIKTGFQKFEFWNGDIIIKIVQNSNRFNQGLLLLNFIPLIKATDNALKYFQNASRLFNLRALTMDAAENNEVCLRIPFTHIKDAMPLGINDPDIDFLGSMQLVVLSPLVTTPDAPQTVDINVMAWFTDSQFIVPSAEDHVIPSLPHGSKQRRNTQALVQLREMVNEELELYAEMEEIAAAFVEPLIKNLLPPIHPSPDLDAPNTFIGAPNTVMGSMASSKSISNHERLALDPGNVASSAPADFDTSSSEMDFAHLLQIPSLLDRVPWKADAKPGTIIWQSYIGPFPKMDKMYLEETYDPTALDYFSAPFAFWSGGLQYDIKLVCNMIATGRLALEVHYGSYTTDATINSGTGQYVQYIDLANDSRTTPVEVSYIASTQRRRVGHGTAVFNKPHDYYTGILTLRVINALNSPGTLSQAADVFISVAAAPNYYLEYECANNVSLLPLTAMPFSPAQYPAFLPQDDTHSGPGELALYAEMDENSSGVVPPDGPSEDTLTSEIAQGGAIAPEPMTGFQVAGSNMMAFPDNFKDAIKKWSPIYTGVTSTHSATYTKEQPHLMNYCVFPVMPTSFSPADSTSFEDDNGYNVADANPGALSWFASCFRFWKGDMRYKCQVHFAPPTLNPQNLADSSTSITQYPTYSGSYAESYTLYAGFTPHTYPKGTSSGAIAAMITDTLTLQRPGALTEGQYRLRSFANCSAVNPSNDPGYSIHTGQYRGRGGMCPFVVSSMDKSFVEIEIPWQSIYRKLMNVVTPLDDTALPDISYFCTGSVWFAVSTPMTNPFGDKGLNEPMNRNTPTFSVYQAAGDNFQVGGYMGVPSVYIRSAIVGTTTAALWPDGYTVRPTTETPLQELGQLLADMRHLASQHPLPSTVMRVSSQIRARFFLKLPAVSCDVETKQLSVVVASIVLLLSTTLLPSGGSGFL